MLRKTVNYYRRKVSRYTEERRVRTVWWILFVPVFIMDEYVSSHSLIPGQS